MAQNDGNPCLTCRKRCPTVPKKGCAWWEPKRETPNSVKGLKLTLIPPGKNH